MTPLPSDNEFRSLGRRCLDFAKASQSNGLDVKLSLSIGRVFSFNYSWENNDNLSLPAVVEDKPKKKTKSPSTRRRDQLRRANFRNRKKSSLGSSGAPLARNGFNMDVPVVTTSKLDCPVSSPSLVDRSSELDSSESEDSIMSTPLSALPGPSSCSPTPASLPKIKERMNCDSGTKLCFNCQQPFLNRNHICYDVDEGNENQQDSQNVSVNECEDDAVSQICDKFQFILQNFLQNLA